MGGGSYRTRSESFLEIDLVGLAGNKRWEVRRRDGSVYIYGKQEESRIPVVGGTGGAFAWLLESIEDVHGNRVEFRYSPQGSNRYLSRVEYTKRSDCLSCDARVIEFEREARPDPRIDNSGTLLRLGQRLTGINVRVNGELLLRYELDYGSPSEDSRRSLLRQVRLYGTDGDPANPARTSPFVWDLSYTSNVRDGRTGWESATGWSLPPNVWFVDEAGDDGGTRLVDMDGDGFPDLVREVKVGGAPENDADSGVYLNVGSQFLPKGAGEAWRLPVVQTPGVAWPFPAGSRVAFVDTIGGEPRSRGVVLTNLNRDGFPDVLQSAMEPYHEEAAGACRRRSFAARWDRSLSEASPGWTESLADILPSSFAVDFATLGSLDGVSALTELNGDGRQDILTRGGLFLNGVRWNQGEPQDPVFEQYRPTDGGDFVRRGFVQAPNFHLCAGQTFDSLDCQRSAWLGRIDLFAEQPDCSDVVVSRVLRFGKRHFDVNGDGLDDHVTAYSAREEDTAGAATWVEVRNVYLNEGNRYSASISPGWIPPAAVIFDRDSDTGQTSEEQGVRLVDVNGDGLADLLAGKDGTVAVDCDGPRDSGPERSLVRNRDRRAMRISCGLAAAPGRFFHRRRFRHGPASRRSERRWSSRPHPRPSRRAAPGVAEPGPDPRSPHERQDSARRRARLRLCALDHLRESRTRWDLRSAPNHPRSRGDHRGCGHPDAP